MRKCKHYTTFGLPRWENANTTQLLDSKDEKMQTLHHFCTPKMRKCKHYTTFGLPRWENANTTPILDSQDEKMQTLHRFWIPKMRKCKHYTTLGFPTWENANTTQNWIAFFLYIWKRCLGSIFDISGYRTLDGGSALTRSTTSTIVRPAWCAEVAQGNKHIALH